MPTNIPQPHAIVDSYHEAKLALDQTTQAGLTKMAMAGTTLHLPSIHTLQLYTSCTVNMTMASINGPSIVAMLNSRNAL